MRKLLASAAIAAVITGGTLAGAGPASAQNCQWSPAWFFFGVCQEVVPPPPDPPPPLDQVIICDQPDSPC